MEYVNHRALHYRNIALLYLNLSMLQSSLRDLHHHGLVDDHLALYAIDT